MRPGEIAVEGVSRRFVVRARETHTLKELLVARGRAEAQEVWALQDVSVEDDVRSLDDVTTPGVHGHPRSPRCDDVVGQPRREFVLPRRVGRRPAARGAGVDDGDVHACRSSPMGHPTTGRAGTDDDDPVTGVRSLSHRRADRRRG